MEKRRCKVHVYKAGGSSHKDAKKFGVGLPSRWVKEMNITPDERELTITFDGSSITIRKADRQGPQEE